MFVRRALIPLALVLFAGGCADENVPTAAPPAPTPHALRWAGSIAPQFIAPHDGLQPSLSSGLSLDRNTVTFWAVRGQQRSVQINYASSSGRTDSPFLLLSITDPFYAPGRGWIRSGDSVLVTVTVDPSNIKVSLEPTGLLFGESAKMKIWYGGAGGDLNGNGVVNGGDGQIESQVLGLWYREGRNSPWTTIPATQSLADKSFTAALRHFSEYEVCFLEYAVSW
jgi:hypothetical protein